MTLPVVLGRKIIKHQETFMIALTATLLLEHVGTYQSMTNSLSQKGLSVSDSRRLKTKICSLLPVTITLTSSFSL